ncbi:MAG: helicase-related protein, partial [Chitinivibrionales bacterium]
VIYSSATPADYEVKKSEGVLVEQVIRPTGLVDPPVEVKKAVNQVDDLMDQLRNVVENNERALVTTLTKKMSEDLTEYLEELGFKVKYLHSEIDTLERPGIINGLRKGDFDILIGINLLREGLDLPEVTLVAILDADKEGFLRSTRSLIQIAGRAARNVKGRIVLYADKITKSIKETVDECNRRREKQNEHNRKHKIKPESVNSRIMNYFEDTGISAEKTKETAPEYGSENLSDRERLERIEQLHSEMEKAAEDLDFEKAAKLRDTIKQLGGKL